MRFRTRITELLGIDYPILQGGMRLAALVPSPGVNLTRYHGGSCGQSGYNERIQALETRNDGGSVLVRTGRGNAKGARATD